VCLLRDTLNRAEFESILDQDLKSRNSLSLARKTVSLILLYITGLRVSNLLSLRTQDIKDLLLKKEMTISLIKRGPNSHRIVISESHHAFLLKYESEINILIKNKTYDALVFSSLKNPNKSYQRAEFTRVLNKVLKKSSMRLMKNLKTHSFRTTFITQLLVNNPVDKICRVVGHKSILSTLRYDRNVLKRKEQRSVIESRLETHLHLPNENDEITN
jgi:site-specific recombinase XerD